MCVKQKSEISKSMKKRVNLSMTTLLLAAWRHSEERNTDVIATNKPSG